ncbi:Alcohol dehydrogenase [Acidisarcina polymorpha]|uniref:Alcohol dehydrogenase n=2 Tax=Acidisarcina polymorpha TaxID=2211140 RepID=A0A2Z5G4U4_9BACT|nr:Alcohol dehydrogenase [Acidisarcina polymorpha]
MKGQWLSAARAPLEWKDLDVPTIGPDEVLIKVHACGVCGSDIHLLEGDFGPFARTPLVPGHEVAGVVNAVGSAVVHLKVNDRVGLGWTQHSCGVCPQCTAGNTSICSRQQVTGIQVNGGYAEYVKATARDVIKIPDNITLEEAAPLMCAGITTYSPLRLLNVRPGQRVVTLGLGGLGHVAVQFAKALGAESIGVARGQDKVELAMNKLGADLAIDSSKTNWVEEVNRLGGANVVLNTANNAQLMGEAVHALAPDGTLVLLAVDPNPLTLPSSGEFIQSRRRLMGSSTGSISDAVEMFELASRRGIRPMIETYPMANAAAVVERVKAGKPRFRAVLST